MVVLFLVQETDDLALKSPKIMINKKLHRVVSLKTFSKFDKKFSLYTNIPNNEVIKTVREAYENHPAKTVATKVMITFLSLILTLNNFIFNYIQIMEWAMGTICAPAFTNIFMAHFEKQHKTTYITLYQK